MTRKRYSRVLLTVAIVLAAIFVYSVRGELLAAISTASPTFAALTVVSTLAYNLVVWLVFHASIGGEKAYVQTSKMFFGAQVAKYVPGKVWSIVYQATFKSSSMPVGNIIQANIVVITLTVISAGFGCAALIIYPSSISFAIAVFVAGAVLSAYVFSSNHLYQFIQRLSALSKKSELTAEVPAIRFSLTARFAVYALLSSLYILSNLFMLYIFFDLQLTEALRLTAYLGIAWLAGVAVTITPSGLGVREIVFVALGSMTGTGGYELYASVAIAARAVQVLQDLVFALFVPFVVGLFEYKDEAGT